MKTVMNFSNRHIVVTGGAGALGTAVVAALLDAGATCRVPCFDEAEAKRFRFAAHKQVETIVAGNLAEEAAVARVFADLPSLWASIHIAGGFAFAALRDADVATIRQQIDMNFLSCILCCRASVQAMTANAAGGGRIVNVAARPALEWRSGANMAVYAASKTAVAALRHSKAGRAATLTMRPPPPARWPSSSAPTARQHKMQLRKFMSICWRIVATSASRSGRKGKAAGDMNRRPQRRQVGKDAVNRGLLGEIAGDDRFRLAYARQSRSASPPLRRRGHATSGAGIEQRRDHRGAERAGAAGDDDMTIAKIHDSFHRVMLRAGEAHPVIGHYETKNDPSSRHCRRLLDRPLSRTMTRRPTPLF